MATKKIENNVEKTAKEVAEKKEKTYKIRIPIDQLNPKDKEFQIGNFNKSKNKLKIEIQKCICLCSNCHRKLHAGKINLENHFNKIKVESVTD